jgi:DNA polymerase III subunit delta
MTPALARLVTQDKGRRVAGRTAAKPVSIAQLRWDRVRPAPVVLVSGTESFLADRSIRLLREVLRAEDPSLEVTDIDAAAYAPGQLITVASPSLFGEPRLIRVTGVEKCTDAFIAETLRYLASPADGAYLVLRHAGGVRGKKLLDALRGGLGQGIEIVCAELKKEAEKAEFVAAEFAAAGRHVTGGAVRSLVGAFSGDLAELGAACSQLIADTAGEVTEGTVETYYAGRVEVSAFRVADAAIAGRQAEALVLLRHALYSGDDPVPILAAFASKLRTMAKVAGVRGGSGQLAQRFGLAPWQVERAQRDLRGWTDAGLGRCISQLAETDAAIKGAERDPVFALERMIGVIARRGASVAVPAR